MTPIHEHRFCLSPNAEYFELDDLDLIGKFSTDLSEFVVLESEGLNHLGYRIYLHRLLLQEI